MLAAIGPEARAALPILKRRWRAITANAPDGAEESLLALIRITPVDEPVLPVLYEARLQGERGEVADIELTAADLASIGMGTFYWSRILVNADRTVQEVPYLVQTAEGHNPVAVRLSAIGILENFGPEARDAIPALRRLLCDENEAVRICAGVALFIVENDRRHVKEIATKLRMKPEQEAEFIEEARMHFEQQDQMLASLRSLGLLIGGSDPDDAEYAENLVLSYAAAMDMYNGAMRRQYIDALRQIGPPAKCAVPRLTSLARNSDAFTREYAEKALWAIDPASAAKLACEDMHCRKARPRKLFSPFRFL
ncbi:MAG: HEAT repeat domain-containing protein [Pirellulales bacterium]